MPTPRLCDPRPFTEAWYALYLPDGTDEDVALGGPGSGHFGHAGRPGERGGSAADDGDSSDQTSDQMKMAAHQADIIRRLDHEECVIIDAKGNVIGHGYGDRERVAIPAAAVKQMEAAHDQSVVFVHNHPDGGSFSGADLRVAAHFNLKEMRAVSPVADYAVRPGARGWTEEATAMKGLIGLLSDRDNVVARLSDEHVRAIYKGTALEAASDRFTHALMEQVADKYQLSYTRTPHGSQ
jgi:hypothetical protein